MDRPFSFYHNPYCKVVDLAWVKNTVFPIFPKLPGSKRSMDNTQRPRPLQTRTSSTYRSSFVARSVAESDYEDGSLQKEERKEGEEGGEEEEACVTFLSRAKDFAFGGL